MSTSSSRTGTRITAKFERITPDIAVQLLATNENNRHLRHGHIESMARDMVTGQFPVTGEAVKIAEDGTLLDGQHRLLACVLANATIETLVVRGLPREVMEVIDSGSKRTLADRLAWRGEKSVHALAAATAWCWRYDCGALRSPRPYATHTESLQWIDENPGIHHSVVVGQTAAKRVRTTPTPLIAAHYLTSRVSLEDADAFMDKLTSGLGYIEGDGVFLFRRWCENQMGSRDVPGNLVIFCVLLKAMNQWRAGDKRSNLTWRRGGAASEDVPTVYSEVQ